jgi:hypothetical protein
MRASRCPLPLALAFGVFAASADAQTTLRLRFEKGASNSYDLSQTMKVEQIALGQTIASVVKQSMRFTQTCDGVEDNGNGRITTRFERARMEVEAPEPIGKFAVDSAEPAPDNPAAAKLAGMIMVLGKLEFAAVMTPRGETINFKIPEETLKKLRDYPGAAQIGGIFTEEGIKNAMVQNKLLLPQEKVSPGAKWTHKIVSKLPFGRLTGEMKYLYQADEGKLQKLTFDPFLTIEPNTDTQIAIKLDSQKGAGTVLFDNAAGRIQEMSLSEALELSVGAMGMNLTQKIDQTMTMKLRAK